MNMDYTFNFPVNAVLLAGGSIKNMPASEPQVPGKGHILVGNKALGAHTLQALKNSSKIGRVTLVTPLTKEQLDSQWEGVDNVALSGNSLMDSVAAGLNAEPVSDRPTLLVAGDQPFLTSEAVDDFLLSCAQKPNNVLWYCFVNKKASQAKYPEVRHTWVKLAEGTYCGGGLTCVRANVLAALRGVMDTVTRGRKSPLKLAGILGWKTLLYLLIGRLTVPMAEAAGARLLGLPCCGICSDYAEAAYNIDDWESLQQARKRICDL